MDERFPPIDAASVSMFVCLRTADKAPLPGAFITTCAHCGEAISHVQDFPPGPPKVCLACALDLVRGGTA